MSIHRAFGLPPHHSLFRYHFRWIERIAELRISRQMIEQVAWCLFFGAVYIGLVGTLRFVRGRLDPLDGMEISMILMQGGLLSGGILGLIKISEMWRERITQTAYSWWQVGYDIIVVFSVVACFWLPLRLAMKHLFGVRWLPGHFWVAFGVTVLFAIFTFITPRIFDIMSRYWDGDDDEDESEYLRERWGNNYPGAGIHE